MTNFSKWKNFESLEVASDKKVKGVDEIRLRLSEYSFLVNMFFRKCHSLVWLFVVKSDDSTIHPPNRHRRCRLTDVVDVDLPMSTTSILRLWNNPFRGCSAFSLENVKNLKTSMLMNLNSWGFRVWSLELRFSTVNIGKFVTFIDARKCSSQTNESLAHKRVATFVVVQGLPIKFVLLQGLFVLEKTCHSSNRKA